MDWDETNAGLGQIAILFNYLVSKFQYKYRFIDYIECNGSFSKIKTNNKNNSKEFYNFFGPVSSKSEEEAFNTVMLLFI